MIEVVTTCPHLFARIPWLKLERVYSQTTRKLSAWRTSVTWTNYTVCTNFLFATFSIVDASPTSSLPFSLRTSQHIRIRCDKKEIASRGSRIVFLGSPEVIVFFFGITQHTPITRLFPVYSEWSPLVKARVYSNIDLSSSSIFIYTRGICRVMQIRLFNVILFSSILSSPCSFSFFLFLFFRE